MKRPWSWSWLNSTNTKLPRPIRTPKFQVLHKIHNYKPTPNKYWTNSQNKYWGAAFTVFCICVCVSVFVLVASKLQPQLNICALQIEIVRYSSFRGIIQCGPLLITFGLTFDQVKESFFHKFGLIFDQRAKWGQLNPGTFLWRGEFVHSQTRDLKVEPFCAMSLLLLTLNFVDEIDKNFCNKINSYF